MSDYLKRAFRAQLTSTMDSLLKRTVVELMTVFENSIHDHQMELAHKGEEVVQLKIKLQTAELKLRDRESRGDVGVEINKSLSTETHRQPEALQTTSGHTANVPEIVVEVPDDWCAPLGCETVTKKEDDVCPSVRLRPLSIPLWHIPVIKKEMDTYRIDSHQQIKTIRRSNRSFSLNKKHSHNRDQISVLQEDGSRRPSLKRDNKFLQETKQQYSSGLCLGRRRHLIEKEQEDTVQYKTQKEEWKKAGTKSTRPETEKNHRKKMYSCKFCQKEFDTAFGRSVHLRTHKTCQGCKKEFPFPSSLKYHKPSCKKLKILFAKGALHTNNPKSESREGKMISPSEKQASSEKEHSPSSSGNMSVIKNDGYAKKHSCTHCNKKFSMRRKLKQHMSLHTDEGSFTCSVCPKTFHSNKALKYHRTRIHKDQINPSKTNGDLAWTKPLEDIADNQEDLVSPSNNPIRTIYRNDRDKSKSSQRWQAMGLQNSDGYVCFKCQKFVKTKRQLTEHFRLHTGEKPLKCEKCLGRFRTCAQLYTHKKQRRCPVTFWCEKCKKKFPSRAVYNKHVFFCQNK